MRERGGTKSEGQEGMALTFGFRVIKVYTDAREMGIERQEQRKMSG